MKDYTLNEKDKAFYITDLIKNRDGTYSVRFADGNVFKNIEANQDNLNKINQIQEDQAREAVSKYKVFKNNVNHSILGVTASLSTFLIGSSAIAISCFNGVGVPLKIAGVGVITLLGSIPSISKLNRDKSKIKELDKIKYRNQHIRELNSFRDYENSLSGISKDTARKVTYTSNPFSILNIDNYSKGELEYIVSNINVEKEYQFTYKKKKK